MPHVKCHCLGRQERVCVCVVVVTPNSAT
jgi:hypothetical protein